MKRFSVSVFLMVGVISCSQKPNKADAYEKISTTFCNCVNKDTSASAIKIVDSCLKLSLNENYTVIKQQELDTSSSNPAFYQELSKKINANCPGYRQRVELEVQRAQDSNYRKTQEDQKTTFTGKFVSQKKLSNGEYEIVVKSIADGSTKTFISSTPVNETDALKPETEVSVRFESNTSSLQDQYPLRAKFVSTIGIIKVEPH